jgi:hypothetical protein
MTPSAQQFTAIIIEQGKLLDSERSDYTRAHYLNLKFEETFTTTSKFRIVEPGERPTLLVPVRTPIYAFVKNAREGEAPALVNRSSMAFHLPSNRDGESLGKRLVGARVQQSGGAREEP